MFVKSVSKFVFYFGIRGCLFYYFSLSKIERLLITFFFKYMIQVLRDRSLPSEFVPYRIRYDVIDCAL